MFLYDEKQIAQGDEPATCGKCQRYTTATSYLKRREAMKTAKKDLTGRAVAPASNDRGLSAPRRLDVATGSPGAAGLPDVPARAGCRYCIHLLQGTDPTNRIENLREIYRTFRAKGQRRNKFRFSLPGFDGVVPFGQEAVRCDA